MRDITVARSFPEVRGRLLVFIVMSIVLLGATVGLLVYGLVARWSAGGLAILAALVVVFGFGVWARSWGFARYRAQHIAVTAQPTDAVTGSTTTR